MASSIYRPCKRALIIGIDNYSNTVPPLTTCVKDAEEKTSTFVGSSEQTSTVDHPAPVVQKVVVTKPATTKTIVSPSTPVVATITNHIPKATNVTGTPGQSARGSGPVTIEPASSANAAAATGEKIVGPLTSIRNFFKHLFSPDPQSS